MPFQINSVQSPSITIGGRVFTDVNNLIVLFSKWTAAATRCTVRKGRASSGYLPSGSKSFQLLAARIVTNTGQAEMKIMSITNDVGFSSGVAFTGVTSLVAGTGTPETIFQTGNTSSTPLELCFGPNDFISPNGFYIGTDCSGQGMMHLFGYEI